MSLTSHTAQLLIAESHPSLSGHFPGNPIVPAVVILDHIAAELRTWRGMRLASVVEAKFMGPLLPGQRADLMLSENEGNRFRFTVLLDDRLLVRGVIEGQV